MGVLLVFIPVLFIASLGPGRADAPIRKALFSIFRLTRMFLLPIPCCHSHIDRSASRLLAEGCEVHTKCERKCLEEVGWMAFTCKAIRLTFSNFPSPHTFVFHRFVFLVYSPTCGVTSKAGLKTCQEHHRVIVANMKPSPAILVTTPTDGKAEKSDRSQHGKEEGLKVSRSEVSLTPSSTIPRTSYLNVDDDANRRPPQQRGGSLAAIRRHTVMIARDVLLRRLSRNDSTSSPLRNRITLDDFGKLVHEVNHMVAAYRQMLVSIGTHSEMSHTRKELSSCRRQCLRTCDAAKECILPLLKDTVDSSADLAKHACHQFIGCLTMFVGELKRTHSLLVSPASGSDSIYPAESAKDDSSYVTAVGSSCDGRVESDVESLVKDLKEAELILETLENAITVHFSTEPCQHAGSALPLATARKGKRNFTKFCLYFQTKYA